MNEELKIKVDVFVGLSRLAGGVLIIIGSILVYFFFQAALDPNAVIEVSGVPTKDKVDKILAVIFASLFPLAGLFLCFVPSKHLDKWFIKAMSRLG